HVPLAVVETLAEEEDVRFIRPADRPFLNKVNTTEGDVAHGAARARKKYSLKGKGVKVGVLSDSVDYLGQVATDLPPVTVLEDAPGNTGEGTAMLEIVHDLAPEAQLYFATAWNGPASFATNIKALADAGCRVIVDDVGYLAEFPFQDDIISQAVNTVTSRGVLYFSSAGNAGNLNDGTSGAWEGDYNPIPTSGGDYATVHDFGGGDWADQITYDSTGCFTLFWSDPLGGSANDYDLFLYDPTLTTIVAESSAIQDGTQDPIEGFCANPGVDLTNYHLVVAKWSGADRFLHLSANRGELEWGTAGQIAGHPAAQDGFGVAAVRAANRTIPFSGAEKVETFSSDGPRRVFFQADGTPVTPGNFSSTGGTVRNKPDIAAADGVKTATPGFNPFYGTSAAAPHAAALGALMLSGKPGLTIADVRQAFQNTALDIETPGPWDRDSGYGIIMADKILDEIGLLPNPYFPWAMFLPAITSSSGAPATPATYWGALSYVYCPLSSATFSLTSGGVTKNSVMPAGGGSGGSGTFEGWVTTTPGAKAFSWQLTSAACGSWTGNFSYTLQDTKNYLFSLDLDGANQPAVYVSIGNGAPATAAGSAAVFSVDPASGAVKAGMQVIDRIPTAVPPEIFKSSRD
ncbi:MAG: S8 family peptidase, partial [Desulfobulbaceae bacterium]